MELNEIKELKKQANDIRKLAIESIGKLGVGHIGGAMSIVEVLTLLYYKEMHIDPANPKMRDRDMLVCSKGHAGPAVYAALAKKGFFPVKWLDTLNAGGTQLPSHCDMNLTPGIDMTTGSLGQGLSTAVGLALGNRLDGIERNVYVIIGDGESQEGQIWEAAMTAAQFDLDRIVAFTDYNKMQIDGYTQDIMDIDNLEAKWLSFGWHVQRCDGHNFAQLENAVSRAKKESSRPSMIIMDTIKGKGCTFAEGDIGNHNMPVSEEQMKEALAALEKEVI